VTFVTLLGCRPSGAGGGAGTECTPTPVPTSPNISGGHYNEHGEWIPDNKTIARTYKMPDMSAGLNGDLHRIRPVLAVELIDYRTGCLDIIGGEDMLGLCISKRWTSIFEIKTGVTVFYDFDRGWRKDPDHPGINLGLSFLIIKF